MEKQWMSREYDIIEYIPIFGGEFDIGGFDGI